MKVLKFGGKSLETVEKIDRIAKKVCTEVTDSKALVVVSAMGLATSELIELSKTVSPKNFTQQSTRELDMLLASGERVSAALFSLALQKYGKKSISFTGSQAGILTEGPHSNAYIKEIKPIRVDAALEQNTIPVIAGFQGVNPITKDITTLGRGGSDLTACAFAHHYSCPIELYKTVGGIYNSDPLLNKNAELIKNINYTFLNQISRWGAKILHDKAADYLEKTKTPLCFKSDTSFATGTLVSDRPMKKEYVITSLELDNDNSIVSLHCSEISSSSILKKVSFKISSSHIHKHEATDCRISFWIKAFLKNDFIKELNLLVENSGEI